MLHMHPVGFETMTLPPSIHKGEGNAFLRNSTICCCNNNELLEEQELKIKSTGPVKTQFQLWINYSTNSSTNVHKQRTSPKVLHGQS